MLFSLEVCFFPPACCCLLNAPKWCTQNVNYTRQTKQQHHHHEQPKKVAAKMAGEGRPSKHNSRCTLEIVHEYSSIQIPNINVPCFIFPRSFSCSFSLSVSAVHEMLCAFFCLYVCMCVCDAMPCIYHLPFAASPLYYSQQFKQYICVDTIYHFVAFYFFYHGYSLVLVETFQSRSLDEFTFICEHRPFLFLFVGE